MSTRIASRRRRWLFVLALTAGLMAAIPLQAGMAAQPPPQLDWMGQSWTVSNNANASVDGNGYAVINRLSGTADATLHINRILPVDPNGVSTINQNGTPWVEVTWEDNGQFRGVDVLIDDEVHPNNPRIQFGSLFNCEGIMYTRYLAVEESIGVGDGCGVAPGVGSRVAGDVHSLYVGKRADGTLDYRYDGVWYQSTLHSDAGIADFAFGDVHLRLRGTDGTTAVFRSFTYGDDHNAQDAVADELSALVESTPISGSASSAASVRRTLLTMAGMAILLAENDQPQLACLQLRLFDLQVRSQVAKRRIAASDANLLYAKTAELRSFICGGPPV